MSIKKIIAKTSIIIALTSFGITNVASANDGKVFGTLIGAAGGAAIGSNVGKGNGKIVAIATGTLLGAAIGNNLSGGDVTFTSYESNRGYYNKHRNWHHRNHNNYYSSNSYYHSAIYPVHPVYGKTDYIIPNYQYVNAPYQVQQTNVTTISQTQPVTSLAEQPYCREFTQTVNVGGKPQDGYGKACRQPDGAWKIVEQF